MKPQFKFIGAGLLLIPGVYLYLLSAHFRSAGAGITLLRRELADSGQVRAENQRLRENAGQAEALEQARKDHAELVRLRDEIRRLQAAADQRRLDSARTLDEQAAQLQKENLRLRSENEQLERAPETVSARRDVDVNELMQIGAAFSAYAKMNGEQLPPDLAQLRYYTSASVFPALETNRFEILRQGKWSDIADPAHTPLLRARFRDSGNRRPYLFADGHLELKEE